MPGLERVPPEVRTVYLGQFPAWEAERIAAELEAAGIVWWSKEPGPITRLWEFGVRLFVDRDRLEAARAVVAAAESDTPG
jgi:hypothetical protein